MLLDYLANGLEQILGLLLILTENLKKSYPGSRQSHDIETLLQPDLPQILLLGLVANFRYWNMGPDLEPRKLYPPVSGDVDDSLVSGFLGLRE